MSSQVGGPCFCLFEESLLFALDKEVRDRHAGEENFCRTWGGGQKEALRGDVVQ